MKYRSGQLSTNSEVCNVVGKDDLNLGFCGFDRVVTEVSNTTITTDSKFSIVKRCCATGVWQMPPLQDKLRVFVLVSSPV